MSQGNIELRGVRVHNLKDVDLDIPHGELIVFCGVSGSGKTSLALDTLYAEGQRRYIESFSAYTRQFLERLEKPSADRIDGIPPAIAVTRKNTTASSRATVGTATEIVDFLRLLYSRIGKVTCEGCSRIVERESPETVSAMLERLPEGSRFMVAFQLTVPEELSLVDLANSLREDGFVRWIVGDKTLTTDEPSFAELEAASVDHAFVVVDRLSAGRTAPARVRESLETAMEKGAGACCLFLPDEADLVGSLFDQTSVAKSCPTAAIDGRSWVRIGFSDTRRCEDCDREYPRMEPRLFSFNSPLGACPECEGFGNVMDIDMELIVPNPGKSISEGAIVPWNTPAYKSELKEFLRVATELDIPVHEPYRDLKPGHLDVLINGSEAAGYGGLTGFFADLEKRKYKMHIRVFISRWHSHRECGSCHGARLRSEALATKIDGRSISELCGLQIADSVAVFEGLTLSGHDREIAQTLLDQIHTRLHFLNMVGLGYLTLDRSLRSLSGGEAQRVSLTSTLGSSLVNMLYVLDEPSVGLHPMDVERLLVAVEDLKNRGNTVVLVEHEESMIRAADAVIEVGPAAGEEGGQITFEGTPEELCEPDASMTGEYMTRRRGHVVPENRREPTRGKVRLTKAAGNNLKGIDVELPLGMLCLVTGVSGSGKSTLIENTLYPALCRRKRKESKRPLPFGEVFGDGQIEDVLLIDQQPIGRSPRSNPVTYIKAFDAIRNVFAETLAARTRNFKASHFSFNVDGGRCEACKGDGTVSIDMQFLADVVMVCRECRGTRYRREVLEIKYRGQTIADVLAMTVRQANSFFRGQTKVQNRLQQLMDVGLDYLRLGQSASTLSAGESQRLKLAGYLSSPRRGRTLFLLDEPTTGLHFSDIVQLLDCFDALIDLGHSLIVVEHNLQMMQAADYIVDLGPGAADQGGMVVAEGSPEEVAKNKDSATGRVLAEAFKAVEV